MWLAPTGGVANLLSGIGGMLTVGFMGTGLVGIGLGHGFGGVVGIAGLAAQLGLVALLLWLLTWAFRRGSDGFALARSGRRLPRERLRPAPRLDPMRTPRLKKPVERPVSAGPVVNEPVTKGNLDLYQEDLDEFEWLLNVVQSAYAREDLEALHGRVTPRIHSYLAEALAVNASRGLISRIYDVRLLTLTISEAIADEDWDYARVALRFEARDVTVDRISGAVVRGDLQVRTEINEVWTFKRPFEGPDAGQWIVSGIRPV